MPNKLYTLILITNDSKIALSQKKRGFGAGNLNGYGGKVKPGESIENAALRELQEEAGVVAGNLEKVATNFFHTGSEILECHVFLLKDYSGDFVESEEMSYPTWYTYDEIPYDNMWQDDKYWLRRVLDGEKLIGNFVFDESFNLLSHEIEISE